MPFNRAHILNAEFRKFWAMPDPAPEIQNQDLNHEYRLLYEDIKQKLRGPDRREIRTAQLDRITQWTQNHARDNARELFAIILLNDPEGFADSRLAAFTESDVHTKFWLERWKLYAGLETKPPRPIIRLNAEEQWAIQTLIWFLVKQAHEPAPPIPKGPYQKLRTAFVQTAQQIAREPRNCLSLLGPKLEKVSWAKQGPLEAMLSAELSEFMRASS